MLKNIHSLFFSAAPCHDDGASALLIEAREELCRSAFLLADNDIRGSTRPAAIGNLVLSSDGLGETRSGLMVASSPSFVSGFPGLSWSCLITLVSGMSWPRLAR